MSKIFYLKIAVEADELLKLKFGESHCLPKAFYTVLGGLGLEWRCRIYPHGLEYWNKERTSSFKCSMTLVSKIMGKGLTTRSQLQLAEADGSFPVVDKELFSKYAKWEQGRLCQGLATPEMVPGRRVEGRWVVLLDPADVNPAAVAQANVDALRLRDADPTLLKLLEAGLGGDASLTDTVLVCADGELRASSHVLRCNAFFAALYGFKETSGTADLRLDFANYSAASVGALLRLLLTGALPPLEDWGLAELRSLLDLGLQVNPEGLPFLKAVTEKILLSHVSEEEELGDLATLADVYDMAILASVVVVRLAARPIHFHRQYSKSIPTVIWIGVDALVENRVDGIDYKC